MHKLLKSIYSKSIEIPSNIAIIDASESLTYKELWTRIEKYSLVLRNENVNGVFGLYWAREADVIAHALAIFYGGYTYVPISTEMPLSTVEQMICTSEIGCVLSTSDVNLSCKVLGRSAFFDLPDNEKSNYVKPLPLETSYIIHTSGSTGQSKAVMISESNFNSLSSWALSEYSKNEMEHVLFATNIGFDLSIFEMFIPLQFGGTVVVEDSIQQAIQSKNWNALTLINTVPSSFDVLNSSQLPEGLKVMNFAGEELPLSTVQSLFEKSKTLSIYNLYGPSECTTYATYQKLDYHSTRTMSKIPIGRPLNGCVCRIADTDIKGVTDAEKGELLIGGESVAVGYKNNQDETRKRFVDIDSNCYYRTGDIVSLKDGLLYYLGREDFQVKFRGYRIELTEIETEANKVPGVMESVCLLRESGPIKNLILFYRSKAGISNDDLRNHFRSCLPHYKQPTLLSQVEAFPLTKNGKIDRVKLLSSIPDCDYYQSTNTVDTIHSIWCSVLSKESVSIDARFFDVGGTSLSMLNLLSKINSFFNIKLRLLEMFELTTISKLAARIDLDKLND